MFRVVVRLVLTGLLGLFLSGCGGDKGTSTEQAPSSQSVQAKATTKKSSRAIANPWQGQLNALKRAKTVEGTVLKQAEKQRQQIEKAEGNGRDDQDGGSPLR